MKRKQTKSATMKGVWKCDLNYYKIWLKILLEFLQELLAL